MNLARQLFPAVLLCFGLVGIGDAAEPKPNIVLFLVDDMGWLDCGAYGSKYYDTPNIDRFASQATRFTSAYSCPLCSPTRATILSGQYSARHGTTTASGHQPPQPEGFEYLPKTAAANVPMLLPSSRNYLEPRQYTLAELLHDAGYRTRHIGKWHLGTTPQYWPESQGFDSAWHSHPDPGPPNYFSPYHVASSAESKMKDQRHIGTITDGPAGEYIVDRVADEAVRFIDEAKGGPFFLNVWQFGVHGPWGHKEALTKSYVDRKDPRGLQSNPIMASMLKSVDESFGKIMDKLEAEGLAQNTIVVFMSDNGGNVHSNIPGTAKTANAENAKSDALADWRKWAGNLPPTNNTPLRDGKGTLYEGGVRVPLMVRWPGNVPAGAVSQEVVGAVDIYPTIADLVGVPLEPKQKLDGVSLAGVLRQKHTLGNRPYFNYFPHGTPNKPPGVTVRQGPWKLIRWFMTGPEHPDIHELYNLDSDLSESQNLAKSMPDKVRELDGLIDGFLLNTGALAPRPNPDYREGAAKEKPQGKPRKPGTPAPAAGNTTTVAEPVNGWRARGCRAELRSGKLIVTGGGKSCFLGIAGLKFTGAAVLKLQTASGSGAGKVQWRTADQAEFPAEGQIVEFQIPAGGAKTVEVPLPVEGSLAHVRVYLPAQNEPVVVESIGLSATGGTPRVWDFSK